jgi:uncharacterized membrane protein
MKYLVRTLMMLVFIPGAAILVLGFLLSIILSFLQFPVWFVWKGEFLEDDDSLIVWYIEYVIGWAEDNWEKMLKWSRE